MTNYDKSEATDMKIIERTANKIVDIIEANGLRGVVLVSKIGSKEMTAGAYASAFQEGALLGAGIMKISQDAVERGEYGNFLNGFISGVANVPNFKKFLERLDAELNMEA